MANQSKRQLVENFLKKRVLKPDLKIDDLARMHNAAIRGWINYYGHFYKSQLYPVFRHMNDALVVWARRKYKKLGRHKTKAIRWLGQLAKNIPELFGSLETGRPACGWIMGAG